MASENKAINLQDAYLNHLRRENIPVTVHVVNGYQLNHLRILGYDNFVVLAEKDDKQLMLYKHAISTITPERETAFVPLGKKKDAEQ